MQDLAGETCVVAQAFWRQDDAGGKVGARKALTLERVPDLVVVEAGRVFARHHRIAEMDMIAMRRRKALDADFALPWPLQTCTRHARQRLQDGECLELQRIELQGIVLRRHRSLAV